MSLAHDNWIWKWTPSYEVPRNFNEKLVFAINLSVNHKFLLILHPNYMKGLSTITFVKLSRLKNVCLKSRWQGIDLKHGVFLVFINAFQELSWPIIEFSSIIQPIKIKVIAGLKMFISKDVMQKHFYFEGDMTFTHLNEPGQRGSKIFKCNRTRRDE